MCIRDRQKIVHYCLRQAIIVDQAVAVSSCLLPKASLTCYNLLALFRLLFSFAVLLSLRYVLLSPNRQHHRIWSAFYSRRRTCKQGWAQSTTAPPSCKIQTSHTPAGVFCVVWIVWAGLTYHHRPPITVLFLSLVCCCAHVSLTLRGHRQTGRLLSLPLWS